MTVRKKIFHSFILIVLLFFLPFINRNAKGQTNDIYGLKFASSDVKKDFRTSLNLSPLNPIEVTNSFTLSFDFSYYRINSAFGYIFRIISDNGANFDFLSKTSALSENDLEFVSGSVSSNVHFNFEEIVNNPLKEWIHSTVHFDLANDVISISLNGVTKSDTFDIRDLKNVRIIFGGNSYNRFSTSDVPPVVVKNVRIGTNGVDKSFWKLDQYKDADPVDIISNYKAEVINPVWVIDEHSKWKLKTTLSVGPNSPVAYNGKDSKVFVVEENQIHIVDLSTDSTSIIKVKSGRPFLLPSNQLIYNHLKNELWEYVINGQEIAKYSFRNNSWDNSEKATVEPAYQHHNKFINSVDNRLMVFGGYGYYTYKNKLFEYDELLKQWNAIEFTGFIKPRYLSALGYSDKPDEVLIFGGYGNESGKQELSPESLYDLHSLNLKTNEFTKLWELGNVDISFAVSNSLIVDSMNGCFYTLCYPVHKYETQLFLARFSLETPEMEVISDSIPYFFQDTESFCDLFYNVPTKELIAITSSNNENNLVDVSIYTLSFPPVNPGDYKAGNQKILLKKNALFIGFALILFLVFIAGMILYRKQQVLLLFKKGKKVSVDSTHNPEEKQNGHHVVRSEIISTTLTENKSKVHKSSIQFLGGFQVYDKNGTEITGLFTPTLKQLFVMILLASGYEGSGVSSELLKDHIWPKKSKESARNIRGVYINKLRLMLSEIGGVQIINTTGSWTIVIDTSVDYDYGRVKELMEKNQHISGMTSDFFSELIMLASKGPMLPNMENDWLDKYKADYSTKIIDVLFDYSKELDPREDMKKAIQIADSIFNHDQLNEDALKLKCRVLNINGKHSLSKNVYDSFARDYFASMGSDFDIKYIDLIL